MRIRARAAVGVAVVAAVAIVSGAVLVASPSADRAPACAPTTDLPGWSVARRWDEALLDAIRRSLPNPPVHARNLFHVSVAMWDGWAAYDSTASGYIFKEKPHVDPCDIAAARNEAISYAAYRVLTARCIKAAGAAKSLPEFADLMDVLSYPTATTTPAGASPAAV